MHEYVKIYLTNSNPVMNLANMKSMEEQLPSDKFMRIHRSYIVNLASVKVIERNRIVFDKSTYIPISEQYNSSFQEFINKNFLNWITVERERKTSFQRFWK